MSTSRALRADLRAALPGWISARILVGVAWLVSLAWIDHFRDGVRPDTSLEGLMAWDGAFYRGLAEIGYTAVGREGVRFFPLLPLLARGLAAVTASPGFWIVVISNVAALVAAMLLHRLCVHDGLGAAVGGRSATLIALLPPAFVFVLGYAESLLLVLAIGTFLALRRERWWIAGLLGALAALSRPTGAFLVLPALIEAGRGWRQLRAADLPGRLFAIAGPGLGVVAFLAWVQSALGDWHIPLDVQDELRGGVANPFVRVMEAGVDLARLDVHGLHFPFAVAMIVLCVVAARRLPASYTAYAIAVVAISLSAENLNSIERYGLDAFPLTIALATLLDRRTLYNVALAVS